MKRTVKVILSSFVISFLLMVPKVFSQSHFTVENSKGVYKQKIELVNDLVVIPAEVNGKKLDFLLDTGVNSTILFSYGVLDSTTITNPTVVYLRGMGAGKPARALKSSGNTIKIGDIKGLDQDIYILSGDLIQLSKRLGVVVHGILGYDFFKDLVVRFNYRREFFKAYEPQEFRYKKCRRCVDIPVDFHENKPYVSLQFSDGNHTNTSLNLLVDSGSGDAIWLFPQKEKNINIPQDSFDDFLGFGISGSVYGKRSRIDKLNIGKYELKQVTSSYPDSLYLENAKSYEERDGSIGSQILRRFHIVVDYPQKNLRFKPNADFKEAFEYNMSGVIVEQSGYRIVKSEANPSVALDGYGRETEGDQVYRSAVQVNYTLEPSYEIGEIRPDSPAEEAGLMIGDEILEINGRPAYRYDLDKIRQIFSSKEGKKIRLQIKREGEEFEIAFRLERIL